MQDKPLDKEMGRCNRNLLLVNAFILGLLLFFAFVGQKYWYNFAFGPFTCETDTLFSTNNAATLQKQFVVLKGEKTLDTGKAEIYETFDRKTGELKDREVRGYYLLLRSGDKAVIIKSPIVTQAVSFEGKLVPVPADIFQLVVKPYPEDLQKRFSAIMLDVSSGYRQQGFIMLFFGLPLLGISCWNLRKWNIRRSESEQHPIIKNLAKQGEARDLAPKLNEEMLSPDKKTFGGITVLRNWIIGRFPFTLDIINFDQLVWVYRLETRHSINFIPTGTSVELVIMTKDKKQHKFSCNKNQANDAIAEIFERAPWIYAGYSDELKHAWNKNAQGMIQEVEKAKSEHKSKTDAEQKQEPKSDL